MLSSVAQRNDEFILRLSKYRSIGRGCGEELRLRNHPSITTPLRFVTQGDKFDYRFATTKDVLLNLGIQNTGDRMQKMLFVGR